MTSVQEIITYRNKIRIFEDRADAGRRLGEMLAPEYGPRDWVMAIPSGGVPVGIEVARRLKCHFDLVIVRKLKIPGNPEAGFGAMTLDGSVFLNEGMLHQLELTKDLIDAEVQIVKKELKTRNRLFRGENPLPELTGQRVIIVDDGLASGYTLMAAIYMMRKNRVREIAVAVPTAPAATIERIKFEVDAVFCLNIREGSPFAVAAAYKDWRDLSDNEVLSMIGDTHGMAAASLAQKGNEKLH